MPLFSHVDYIKRAAKALIDALTANECLGCGSPGVRLCFACVQNVPRTVQRCIGCRRSSPDGVTCVTCMDDWHVHRLLAATAYRHTLIKRSVAALKYRYDRSLIRPLALRLLTALHGTRTLHTPLFVPVPLHARRKRWRGFNQAELLAQDASDLVLYGYAEPLRRVRNTVPQTKTPGRTERLDAMSDAFRVADPAVIENRHIILVDDVCTTGATLNACGKALLESGARSVTALVIARA